MARKERVAKILIACIGVAAFTATGLHFQDLGRSPSETEANSIAVIAAAPKYVNEPPQLPTYLDTEVSATVESLIATKTKAEDEAALDVASLLAEAEAYFQAANICDSCDTESIVNADINDNGVNAMNDLAADWNGMLGSMQGTIVRESDAPNLKFVPNLSLQELGGTIRPRRRGTL